LANPDASDAEERFAAFLEDRKQRTPAGGSMYLGRESSGSCIEVRSVASAPGDPFARLAFAVADPEVSARFYCETLGMREVFRNEQDICVRFTPAAVAEEVPPESSSSKVSTGWGQQIPTTLVFNKKSSMERTQAAPAGSVEAFDHFAVSCVDIERSWSYLSESLPTASGKPEGSGAPLQHPSLFLPPMPMFGTKVCGLTDPDGMKIYLVEEAGFRAETKSA
jgi:catechol 2,3-dioxygenase-like lactoylglutathione lyase family enzyme